MSIQEDLEDILEDIKNIKTRDFEEKQNLKIIKDILDDMINRRLGL